MKEIRIVQESGIGRDAGVGESLTATYRWSVRDELDGREPETHSEYDG